MSESRRPARNPIAAVGVVASAVVAAAALVALRLHFQPPVVPFYALTETPSAAPSAGMPSAGTPSAAPSAGTPSAEPSMWAVLPILPSTPFSVTLTPRAPVEGAIAIRGFLLRGEEVRPWEVPFVVDRDGTVHVSGQTDVLFAGVPDGPWEMALAVGRPEVLPTAPHDVLRARDHDPAEAGWHLVRRRISITGMRGEPSPRTP